jgi:hypothetical protein
VLIQDKNLLSGIKIVVLVQLMVDGQVDEGNIIPKPLTGVIQVVVQLLIS